LLFVHSSPQPPDHWGEGSEWVSGCPVLVASWWVKPQHWSN